MQFEDFLEAIVRLSTMTGWPSDAEIDRAGYTDAGEYLLSLQPFPAVYERFVAGMRRRGMRSRGSPSTGASTT